MFLLYDSILCVIALSEKNNAEIVELMKQEIKKDRSKVEVFGFTKLGLLEMTRKEM